MFSHGPECLEGPVSHTFRQIRTDSSDTSIRFELVARIRREIAAGVYDTPDKWEAALLKLFDHLDRE
jgi:hypothetical protein